MPLKQPGAKPVADYEFHSCCLSSAVSGTWNNYQANGSQAFQSDRFNTSAADGNYLEFSVVVPANSNRVRVLSITGAGFAIQEVLIDGTSCGTVDLYAGVGANNYEADYTIPADLVLGYPRAVTLRIKITGKNALATAYQIRPAAFWFRTV